MTGATRTTEATAAAMRFLELRLAGGPALCREVTGRAEAAGIPRGSFVRAKTVLGVEVVRGDDGEPRYALPDRPSGRAAA